MNRENLDFLYKMFPCHDIENLDIIIVNQTSKDAILRSSYSFIKVINSFEKGLSKSRNLALNNATAKWCLIADDDLVYVRGFDKIIEAGINKYESSGVIIFKSLVKKQISRRKFPKKSKQHLNAFERFDVASFEMLLNRTNKQVAFFNESFGLGSDEFLSGEEGIVMHDYLTKHREVSYFNGAIVYHPIESTGTLFNHPLRYYTKGGTLKYMYPKLFMLWIVIQLFFDLKQRNIKFVDIYKNYKEALRGANMLKKITDAAN